MKIPLLYEQYQMEVPHTITGITVPIIVSDMYYSFRDLTFKFFLNKNHYYNRTFFFPASL